MSEPTDKKSSRREFVKGSTTAAVTAALAANIALPRSAYAAGSDEIRVALIGCGGRGTGAAGQALSTNGKVKLVAMADAFKDRMDGAHRALANKFKKDKSRVGVDEDSKYVGFDAYKKILDRSDVDMVILTTPPGFRPMHFEYAVSKGKHVFMEKPVATDATGIRRVLAAAEVAKTKNLKVGVGLQRHHQKSYQETIKRIHDGAIGKVITQRVYWNGGGVWVRPRTEKQTEMEYQMRNWYYFNWLCGDHITEQHIHNLDIANWVAGSYPVEANGMGGREVRKGKDHGQIFDHHMVEFTYADGSKTISQCRHIRGCWNSVSEAVHGEKGTAVPGRGISMYNGENWKADGGKNPYQVEHDDLFAAIRADKPYNEAEYGAKSTMTSILGRMATYSGKSIKWDAAINSKVQVFPHSPDYKWAWDGAPPVVPDSAGNYPVPVPGKSKVV